MSDYDDGASGQVENESYCMKKSFQARNVESMNEKMGYYNMADQANTAKPPTPVTGDKSNKQLGPMAGKGTYNYNADR